MTTIDIRQNWEIRLSDLQNKYPEVSLFNGNNADSFGFVSMKQIVAIDNDTFIDCIFEDIETRKCAEVLVPEKLVANISDVLEGRKCFIWVNHYDLKFVMDNDGNVRAILGRFAVAKFKKQVGVDDKENWISLKGGK